MHSLERPLFSVGIHLNSDAGTRSQRGQDQFERVRPRVFATVLARFVPLEHMRADGYVLDKSQRSRIYGYISRHIPLLYLPVRASQGAVLNTALVHDSHSICPLINELKIHIPFDALPEFANLTIRHSCR